MAQKIVAEADTLGGSFNEPGNVCHDETTLIGTFQLDYAKVGLKGGERIVGYFGLGSCGGGQKGRFADIGQANDADIGKKLEGQLQRLTTPG